MNKRSLLSSLLLISILMLSCRENPPDWPSSILSAIWVPKEASKANYYMLEGSYQAAFTVNSCYPSNEFIDTMVNKMTSNGWRRLVFDSLNPKIKLNHARALGGIWSHISSGDGSDVYQWIDEWENPNKNLVRYWLRFQAKGKVTENTCTLEVVAIYIPFKIRQQSESE